MMELELCETSYDWHTKTAHPAVGHLASAGTGKLHHVTGNMDS